MSRLSPPWLGASAKSRTITLSLPYRPPLDWQSLLGYFRAHHIAGIEVIDEVAYQRIFRIGSNTGAVHIVHDRSKPQLRLRILANDPDTISMVAQKVRRMFDPDSDPQHVTNHFASHKPLAPLWEKSPGLRVASGWDPFETSVATILGQLVSTRQARSLIGQLVESHGERTLHPITGELIFLFPRAATLARADLEAVRTTPARKRAIQELSKLVATRQLDLNGSQDPSSIKQQLLALPGIGVWTAECIGLRALDDRDAFPRTDLVLKRAIEQCPDLDVETVRPLRGYAAVCSWSHFSKGRPPKKENLG